jgi:hypothetical protein
VEAGGRMPRGEWPPTPRVKVRKATTYHREVIRGSRSGLPSLDGRCFASTMRSTGGEVSAETVFRYQESGGVIWAEYGGGSVLRGYLVGTRAGERLTFRYTHLHAVTGTASGRCESSIEVLPDGRLRLHEAWSWESRTGSGSSVLEEILQAVPPGQ